MLPIHKLPPKGAFSSVFSVNSQSKTPEPKVPTSQKYFSSPDSDSNIENEFSPNQEFNDMFQYAQLALQKSCEVQEDIAKLFSMWETNDHGDVIELWKFLDKVLQENGFKPLGNGPSLKKISKVLIDLIAELKVLRQTSLDHPENEKKKDFFYKDYAKSLEDELGFLKSKVSEFHEFSLLQLKKDNNLLKEIQNLVEANEESEIISKIISYKNIIQIIPRLEIFVEEVCKEFVPEIVQENNYESFSIALKEVFPRIKNFKSNLEKLTNFKGKVYKCLRLDLNTPEVDVIEKIGAVVFFQKLFTVDASEDILGVMEKVFLYFVESKNALEYVKYKLQIDAGTSAANLTEEIRKKL